MTTAVGCVAVIGADELDCVTWAPAHPNAATANNTYIPLTVLDLILLPPLIVAVAVTRRSFETAGKIAEFEWKIVDRPSTRPRTMYRLHNLRRISRLSRSPR